MLPLCDSAIIFDPLHNLSLGFAFPYVSMRLNDHEEVSPDANVQHDCQFEKKVAEFSADVDKGVVDLVIQAIEVVSSIVCPYFNRVLSSRAYIK